MSYGGYQHMGARIISVKVNRNAMAMQFARILADEKVPSMCCRPLTRHCRLFRAHLRFRLYIHSLHPRIR
jgi:hypothetical protein